MGKNIISIIFILFYFIFAQNDVPAQNGMVVSASRLASEIGVEIMKSGGNAVDAAVATGFALAVTYPQAGNIGGGGFLVAHLADGRNITIDFRESAPHLAHREMYLDGDNNVIKNMSLLSHKAAGVPGSVAGLITAWRFYGSQNISLKQLLKPAIQLAKDGFIITEKFAQDLNNSKSKFGKDVGSSKIFIKNDRTQWQEDDVLVQADLASTLQRIAKYGINGFYSGKTAELMIKEMERGSGLIAKKRFRII